MQPSANTLLQMFGDDKPIGSFSQECYSEDLRSAADISSAINAVTKYAQDLHGEQARYEQISPYGGEDITVSSVWEIAMGEISTLQKLPIFSGMSDTEIKCRIVKDFVEKDSLPFSLTGFVQNYEELSTFVSDPETAVLQVKKQLENRDQALGKYESAVKERASVLRSEAREEYGKAKKELEALNRRWFSRIFRKNSFSQEKEALEYKMEECTLQVEFAEDKARKEVNIFHFVKATGSLPRLIDVVTRDGYLETGHLSYVEISSVEEARTHIKEVESIVHFQDNRGLYEYCCHLLGREPIQLSVPKEEESARISVKDRLQEARKELVHHEQLSSPSQAIGLGRR